MAEERFQIFLGTAIIGVIVLAGITKSWAPLIHMGVVLFLFCLLRIVFGGKGNAGP